MVEADSKKIYQITIQVHQPFFPLSHLEGFKKIQSEALKIKLEPKYIVTAFGHVVNDLFKIWLAEVLEKKKSKLVISSHGGYV